MEVKSSIPVQRYSAWNRAIKANFSDIFKALTRMVGGIVNANIATSVEATRDLLVGLTNAHHDPVPHRAYVLTYNALRSALKALVEDSQDIVAHSLGEKVDFGYDAVAFDRLVEGLDFQFEEKVCLINGSFLDRPDQIPLLEDISTLFSSWLRVLGVSTVNTVHITSRLKPYFVHHLNLVWQRAPSYFNALKGRLVPAFDEDIAWGRVQYNNELILRWHERIFDSAFGLKEIYIPLRACYSIGAEKSGKGKYQVIHAEKYILDWIGEPDPVHRVVVLRGGPGSGKSSLMKRIAMRMVTGEYPPVYFIPLHQFHFHHGIVDGIRNYLVTKTSLSERDDPFSRDLNGISARPVFIFDGLDELSLSGSTGRAEASEFIRQLYDLIAIRHLVCRVILTGRDFIIQQVETTIPHQRGQVLELLPYWVNFQDSLWQAYAFEDPDQLLMDDQRQTWWNRYWNIVGEEANGIPPEFNNRQLQHLTAQPLLNYLMAIAHRERMVDSAASHNLNLVYLRLIDSLRLRKWGDYKHIEISEADFFQVLEAVALSAWLEGDLRTTTISRIERQCKHEEIDHLAEKFRGFAARSCHRLIMATFMRGVNRREGEEAVEFTHKSFGEYLLARRIVRDAEKIAQGLQPHSAKSIHLALQAWVSVYKHNALDHYMWRFLKREAELFDSLHGSLATEAVQSKLAILFASLIHDGFDPESRNSNEVIRFARNAESSLLLAIAAFARVTCKLTEIEWAYPNKPRRFLSRLILETNSVVREGLSYLTFPPGCDFESFHLGNCDLEGAVLKGGKLSWAILERSVIRGANFEDADLAGTDLTGTNAQLTNFTCANLKGASLQDSMLEGANLQGAILAHANLEGAMLERANLRGANLEAADLAETNLRWAHMQGSNLEGANLAGADLEEAALEGANLQGANLERANLKRAQLKGVVLDDSTRLPAIPRGHCLVSYVFYHSRKVFGAELWVLLAKLSA